MKKIIKRREFINTGAAFAAAGALSPFLPGRKNQGVADRIRLGGPVPGNFTDPSQWSRAVKSLGYSAAYAPLQAGASSSLIKAFREEARSANILIAEVGVWNNLFDPVESVRKENMKKNIESLQLADELGAKCCVNISGARGEIWDGPYAENFTDETFDMIVENVRNIIDNVKPSGAFYTLEPMPYMLPDSPDTYLRLIRAINRKQFAAHLDPVNMISSPRKYYNNAGFLRECFTKLGPYIKSIHAKDIIIRPKLTLHLDECRPGLGALDYAVLLKEACKLKNVPVMMEHLEKQEDYKLAAEYIRKTGEMAGIGFIE
jgi:sugar phosphate isomerase/epimerase